MTYTGDVASFKKLIAEGEHHADGTVTITVPPVKEAIDNEFIDKHVFEKDDGLKQCQMTWQVFTNEQWIEAFDVLSERPDINSLYLEHGKMDREVMKKLAENRHLIDLTIETMDTADEVSELAAMPCLRSLSLIRINPLSGAALIPFANKETLTSLTIKDGDADFSGIEKLVKENASLTRLRLDSVDTLTQQNYAVLFSSASLLKELTIGTFDGITPEALEPLAENTTLQKLTIEYTPWSMEAMEKLVANTTISELHFWHCDGIDDAQIALLCQSANIKKLSLRGNSEVTDEGATHLAENTNLVFLDIRSTGIKQDGLRNFLGNTTLLEIKIADHIPKKLDAYYQMVTRVGKAIANNVYRTQDE